MERTAISVRVHELHNKLVCSTLADTDAARNCPALDGRRRTLGNPDRDRWRLYTNPDYARSGVSGRIL